MEQRTLVSFSECVLIFRVYVFFYFNTITLSYLFKINTLILKHRLSDPAQVLENTETNQAQQPDKPIYTSLSWGYWLQISFIISSLSNLILCLVSTEHAVNKHWLSCLFFTSLETLVVMCLLFFQTYTLPHATLV